MAKDDFSDLNAPIDYRHPNPVDLAVSAVRNYPRSYVNATMDAVKPIYPSNWLNDAKGTWGLASGLASKAGIGPQDKASKEKNEAVPNALGRGLAAKYGSLPAFYKTLANDPASIVSDLGALATIPAGGEGLAAKIPGAVGDVARAGTAASRVFSEAGNPISLGARAVQGTAGLARKAIQGPILDKSGALSSGAQKVMQTAFPGGRIGAAELADPAFNQVVADTMKAKGVTPDAAREAVLTYHGIKPSKSAVTGVAAPKAASGVAEDMSGEAEKRLGSAATQLAGGPPDPKALGAAVQDAFIGSKNNVHNLYDQLGQLPGQVDPSFHDILQQKVYDALAKNNLGANRDQLGLWSHLPQTQQAVDDLTKQIPALAQTGGLSFPTLEQVRKGLVSMGQQAKGTDKFGVGLVKGAYDDALEDGLNSGMLTGGDPAKSAAALKAARKANADHADTFASSGNTTDSTIKRAVREFSDADQDANGQMLRAGPGSETQAQSILSSGLLTPSSLKVKPGAEKLYNQLSDLSPDVESALKDHIRQTVLATDNDGHMVANADKLNDFSASPLASLAFSPDELTKLKLIGAAKGVMEDAPKAKDATLGDMVGRGARTAVGAGIGYAGSHFLGVSPEVGGLVGGAMERGAEALGHQGTKTVEKSGAPANLAPLRTIEGLGNTVAGAARIASVPDRLQADMTQPDDAAADDAHKEPSDDFSDLSAPAPESTGGRIGRASGGRVDKDKMAILLEKLLARSKALKKTMTDHTKPLLNVPDSAVAKALEVAQRGL